MLSPPFPDPSGVECCFHCGGLLEKPAEFCPHCGARLRPKQSGCSGPLKVLLLFVCAVAFGGAGACAMSFSNIGSGAKSLTAEDFLFGAPGFFIAALFVIGMIKEVLRLTRR